MTANPRSFRKQFIAPQPQQINIQPPPYQAYPSFHHFAIMAANNPSQNAAHLPLQGQVTHPAIENDSEDDDSSTTLSEIQLGISAPLRITGDNNIISIDTATNASRISLAVVSALRQISTAGGVPMLDANGELRPIRVDVMAETTVEGNGNTIGERAVLSQVVDRDILRRMESVMEAESAQIKIENENGNGAQPLQKRGWGLSDNGQALGSELKRARRD
ncbi:hypothetical protein BGZ60DRAFT_412725 [Tricladium varicosporioides]|nr:hypothetical protein BGZ60DRAFT_412725 [Hymenoscyphus varicosporioides]